METNKKQTALSWLKDQIIDNKDIYIKGNTLMIPNDIFRKAQQMEREQIEKDYNSGFRAGVKWQAEQMYSVEEVKEIIAEAWLSCEDNEGETFTEANKRILEKKR